MSTPLPPSPVRKPRASWWRHARQAAHLGERSLNTRLAQRDLGSRLAWAWRWLRHRAEHRRLLEAFEANELMASALAATPTLGFKVLVPCHVAGLTVAERVDRVLAHHRLLLHRMGAPAYRAVHVSSEGLTVGHVALPGGHGQLTLRLIRHAPSWREGEATLALMDPFGTLLYTLSFSLAEQGALIGGLIGVTPLDNIRHLTRLMQGLRPQSLMLHAMQQLVACLELPALQAVGRMGHVFARTERQTRLQFDYDAFWLEHGGVALDPEGRLWQLPLQAQRRSEADTPSQKRAMYRRRHQMLDEMQADMAAHLSLHADGA